MKYNLFSITLVILTVIIIILPITLAPWTLLNQPQEPENPLESRTCPQWLVYNGFISENYALNKSMAITRAIAVDYKAFFWSAGYAYYLSSYTTSNLTPEQFCIDRGVTNPEVYYWAIKDVRRTCYDWIYVYGYEFREGSNRNYEIARSRDKNADNFITHFAAGYGQFLSTHSEIVSPLTYCTELKVHEELLFPLIPRNIPLLTCLSWLKVHGFVDDVVTNHGKARQGFNTIYLSQVHLLAKQYNTYMLEPGYLKSNPALWCETNNMDGDTPIRFYSQ